MRLEKLLSGAFVALSLVLATTGAVAADAAQIGAESQAALKALYAKTPAAQALGEKAKAILVFPNVKKAGLGVGGQYGEGALIQNGAVVGYFSTAGASFGLQAGVEKFSYAMFFMTDEIIQEFKTSKGFEVGVGPDIVIIDEGRAKNFTTATIQEDIYAFIFGQKGLMAGLGIKGNKITKIEK